MGPQGFTSEFQHKHIDVKITLYTLFQKTAEETIFQLIPWSQYKSDSKARQINISYEYWHMYAQKN